MWFKSKQGLGSIFSFAIPENLEEESSEYIDTEGYYNDVAKDVELNDKTLEEYLVSLKSSNNENNANNMIDSIETLRQNDLSSKLLPKEERKLQPRYQSELAPHQKVEEVDLIVSEDIEERFGISITTVPIFMKNSMPYVNGKIKLLVNQEQYSELSNIHVSL
jgi:hypothetical protein